MYNLKLWEENGFLPDFDSIPKEMLRKAKLLYINYPNNPTGQVATVDFYKVAIDFALKNDIVIIQDAAYAALTYDGNNPFSFLTVDLRYSGLYMEIE